MPSRKFATRGESVLRYRFARINLQRIKLINVIRTAGCSLIPRNALAKQDSTNTNSECLYSPCLLTLIFLVTPTILHMCTFTLPTLFQQTSEVGALSIKIHISWRQSNKSNFLLSRRFHFSRDEISFSLGLLLTVKKLHLSRNL